MHNACFASPPSSLQCQTLHSLLSLQLNCLRSVHVQLYPCTLDSAAGLCMPSNVACDCIAWQIGVLCKISKCVVPVGWSYLNEKCLQYYNDHRVTVTPHLLAALGTLGETSASRTPPPGRHYSVC